MKWGRVDAGNCSEYALVKFPSGAMSSEAMFGYFQATFNFTAPEVESWDFSQMSFCKLPMICMFISFR